MSNQKIDKISSLNFEEQGLDGKSVDIGVLYQKWAHRQVNQENSYRS